MNTGKPGVFQFLWRSARHEMYAIKTENLTKKYDESIVVNQLRLNIRKGEIFGLLGPNGAGKTTTIKILATLLKPTSGSAEVWGYNVLKEQDVVRKSIGIVFQSPSLDFELTGRENLDFHSRIYNLDRRVRKNRIEEVLELVELSDKADTLVKHYSGGMQRRLEIARGLMHYPNVLFLDEPTLGLDTQTRRRVWEYIKKLNASEQITVVLTTHYMDEAEQLCDRVAIIDHGEIIALDSPENLKTSIARDIISLQVVDQKKFLEVLKSSDFAAEIIFNELVEEAVYLGVENGEKMIPRIMELASKQEIFVNSMGLHRPTLEDVFLHFTGKTIRKEETGKMYHMQRMLRTRMRN